MQVLLFLIFSSLTILSALAVVSLRKVVHCAFALLFTFFNIACLFILLGAEFLAAVQILIYAGAVMILFIFTLMLIDLRKVDHQEQFHRQLKWVVAGAILLAVETVIFVLPRSSFLAGARPSLTPNPIWENNSVAIGEVLFTEYLFPFEVASVVLLVAVVAAVILGKSRISVSGLKKDGTTECTEEFSVFSKRIVPESNPKDQNGRLG